MSTHYGQRSPLRRTGAARRTLLLYHHHTLSRLLPSRAIVWENYYGEKENGVMGLPMPLLEDATSIQIGYMQVVYAVLRGHLETSRARVALAALRAAARNLPALKLERGEHVGAEQELPDDACYPEVRSWPNKPYSVTRSGAPEQSPADAVGAAAGAANTLSTVGVKDAPLKKPAEGLKSTG